MYLQSYLTNSYLLYILLFGKNTDILHLNNDILFIPLISFIYFTVSHWTCY